MLSQSEMDKAVIEAKKSLSDEQIKDAVRKCSYGGNPVDMAQGGICSKTVLFGDFGPDKPEAVIPLNKLKGGDKFG